MEVAAPSAHAIGVLALTALAFILFTRERIPLETSSLVVFVLLTTAFILFPHPAVDVEEFFAAFGHKALVAVSALMVVGQSLVRTGALEPVGRTLATLWRRAPGVSLLATLIITAFLSAFINNTPIVVLMLPLLIGVAVRNKASPTGMLLPMGLVSVVGGMATTIGTSTNLLVVSVAEDMGMASFGMFDFAIPALLAGVVAIVYLWLIAPRLLPERQPPMAETSRRVYDAQIVLSEDSVASGLSLGDAIDRTGNELKVDRIQRGRVFVTPLPDVELKPGDRLNTSDTAARLREFAGRLGGELYSGEFRVDDSHPLSSGGQQLAEVAITSGSRLAGTRVADARLSSRYGLRLLALHRGGEKSVGRGKGVEEVVLRNGDVLLVQADAEQLAEAKRSGDLLVLDGSIELPHTTKAPLALAILVAVVALAAFQILPIEVSAVAGCLVLLITRCLTWRDATRALSVQVIFVVASSLALGYALMRTGGADFLAQLFLAVTFGSPAPLILGGLMLLMAVLTNIVSNNATAVIGTPIAIGIATRLGLPVEPFVLAVLFGANLSFVTPMAYKTNLLVMNAGGYRFGDFVRVGLPLMLLMWVSLSLLLVWAYRLF